LFETLTMTNVNEKKVMFELFQTRILVLKLETSTILASFGV